MKFPSIDINIPNYSYKFCPTESNAGGTLIYIRIQVPYKTWNDLNINKSFERELHFIEICNPKKANNVTGCIYKNLSMNVNELNDDYLNGLLDKLSKKIKLYFSFGILALAY